MPLGEFDFATSASRARAFTIALGSVPAAAVRSSALSAPATDSDLQVVERALGGTLPTALRELFTRGTATLDCAYVYEPDGQALDRLRALLPDQSRIFGGAKLGPASALADYSVTVREWARDTWIAEFPDQRAIWESALPFVRLDNGDYLALDLRVDGSEPPVTYLCHDEESFQLAPNLLTFLSAWEGVCYVGPEHWLLRPFTDDVGHLDAGSDRAALLRALLGR